MLAVRGAGSSIRMAAGILAFPATVRGVEERAWDAVMYYFLKSLFKMESLSPARLRNKRVLLIGGGGFNHIDGRSITSAEVARQSFLACGVKECVKVVLFYASLAEQGDCRCAIEEIPSLVQEEPFDVVFLIDGLEKIACPTKAVLAIRQMCRRDGRLMICTRSPVDLSAKYSLAFYEDRWRYTAESIRALFPGDHLVRTIPHQTGIIFLSEILKTGKNTLHEDARVFNCRAGREITYAESLQLGYFRQYTELESIGAGETTDKNSYSHNYLEKYEFFLRKWKDRSFNLLELGIFTGGSARMWQAYFPKAMIHCVDIDEECRQHADDRIIVSIMDLSVRGNLEKLKAVKPEIIIDDASHLWSHQISALFTLFDALPSGGVYILEDLETSTNTELYPGFDDCEISAYDVCERIARVVMSKLPDEGKIYREEITRIGMAVEMISLMKGSCVLIKR